MDYQVAIPTHRRAALCNTKTLAYLRSTDVDLDRVTLFLSDAQDEEEYAGVDCCKVVTGATCVRDKFNAVHVYYPEGTKVVLLEDDIALVQGKGRANDKQSLRELVAVIERGFQESASLWGVAPHGNAMYFSGKVTRTLKLVVAHAYGFVSMPSNRWLLVSQPSKTDYERTCRYYTLFGETVRLDWVGVDTNSYTQPGGMQADVDRSTRAALELQSCQWIVEHFSHLITFNTKKKSLFSELRFLACRMTVPQLVELQRAIEMAHGSVVLP